MYRTYFDRNQNLQINGDINFIFNGSPSQDDSCFFRVTQRVRPIKSADSQAVEQEVFKILCDNTAPSARYGHGHSFTGPQCYPGTRIAVQNYIFKWLDDPDGQIAMWMNGPVGIGKSAIAQTVAHLAAERAQLSSAFFFFRSDDTRNNPRHLVPTLAYEMTQQMPHRLSRVCRTVAGNPLIFSSSLDSQIESVLMHSLYTGFESSPRPRRLIIIDGLDECLDINTQQGIIRSFMSSLLSKSTRIIPHKLLIVSRAESHISSSFLDSSIRSHVKHFPLNSWSTRDDIETLLRDKLKEIKETHPMRHHLPDMWPDEDSFRDLLDRSVGSFAYAGAVIRFLASHKHTPQRALQDILSLRPHQVTAAFAELDALYLHILSSLDSDIWFTVQKLLCLHLYSGYGQFACLATGLSEEQPILEVALIHVSSIINFDRGIIELHHSSFGEFVRDKERCGKHYVFSANICGAVATALSNLWLRSAHNQSSALWFRKMGTNLSLCNNNLEMDLHILRTLIATTIPADIFTINQCNQTAAVGFFLGIQSKSVHSLDSTYGPLYNEALNVVCVWLRSQLNVAFQGGATLSDMLDIIQGNRWVKTLPFLGLGDLVNRECKPIDFLCRLFPEMDCAEVCDGIVAKYLALPIESRRFDINRICRNMGNHSITFNELYSIALECRDAMIPKLCHRLEQLVLSGQKAWDTIPIQYRTSKNCIFRCLYYGVACHIDGVGQFRQKNNSDFMDSGGREWDKVVEQTDNYIRQVHAKLVFPYISEDVEALYHLQPEKFQISVWPPHA